MHAMRPNNKLDTRQNLSKAYPLMPPYLVSSPAFIESGNLFACCPFTNALLVVYRGHALANVMRTTQGVYWRSILRTKLVATATSLDRLKKLQIIHLQPKFYQSCKFCEDRSDVEIIGLTEISKSIIKKIKQQQNRSAGGLKLTR